MCIRALGKKSLLRLWKVCESVANDGHSQYWEKSVGNEVLSEIGAGTTQNDQVKLKVGYITIPTKGRGDHFLVQ